jgi:LysR family transcriptional regulator, glycine cleavage system transcriptional activator
MQALPLQSLRAFEAAARTGSFRGAAMALGLTPSAVSHAIRGLEKAIGASLFQRIGRSVQLTVAGETLIGYVERGFAELRMGVEGVAARGGEAPVLRLHCAPSFATQWLVPRLPRLLGQREGLEVRIAAGIDYSRFLNNEFDADVLYGRPAADFYGTPGHEGVEVMPLCRERITPLCSPEMARHIATPQDLLSQRLIESENKKVRWREWFQANGLIAPPPRGSRFDRSFIAISAAADGLGVALESTLLAERELRTGRLVCPMRGRWEDVTYIGHFLAFPRSQLRQRAFRLFHDWIRQELNLDGTQSAAAGG